MRRRLLVVAALFVVVFAATYAATSATGSALIVAFLTTGFVAFIWTLALDVRRRPFPSGASERNQGVVYAATAIAALHGPGQAGSDCPTGFDGGADCGAGGV